MNNYVDGSIMEEDTSNLVDFILMFGRLKRFIRTGWLAKGIPKGSAESIADHVLRTAIISLLMADITKLQGNRVDELKVLRLALMHDLPEVVLKDIDKEAWSHLNVDSNFKRNTERKAMQNLLNMLPETLCKKYFICLLYTSPSPRD